MTQRSILVTDADHFVAPAVIERLRAGGARVIAADEGFVDGGDALKQTTPAETVAKALALTGGHLDAVVIAGTFPAPRTPAETLTPEITRPFFEKIAIEPLAYVAAAVPHLKAGGGQIVFLSSAGPMQGIPGFAAYAAARSAITGAVKSLALELAPVAIGVNAVAFNYIQTEAYYPRAWLDDPAKRAKLLARVPLGRLGDPAEAAEAVALFAEGRAGFATGQVLSMSGGSS